MSETKSELMELEGESGNLSREYEGSILETLVHRVMYILIVMNYLLLPFVYSRNTKENFLLVKETVFRFILIILLSLFIFKVFSKGTFTHVINKIPIPVLLFTGLANLSLFYTAQPSLSLAAAAIILSYLIYYVILLDVLKKPKDFFLLSDILVFAAFVSSLYGVLQYYGLDPIFTAGEVVGNCDRKRVFSFFGNPVFLGVYLDAAIPIALALLVHSIVTMREWWGKETDIKKPLLVFLLTIGGISIYILVSVFLWLYYFLASAHLSGSWNEQIMLARLTVPSPLRTLMVILGGLFIAVPAILSIVFFIKRFRRGNESIFMRTMLPWLVPGIAAGGLTLGVLMKSILPALLLKVPIIQTMIAQGLIRKDFEIMTWKEIWSVSIIAGLILGAAIIALLSWVSYGKADEAKRLFARRLLFAVFMIFGGVVIYSFLVPLIFYSFVWGVLVPDNPATYEFEHINSGWVMVFLLLSCILIFYYFSLPNIFKFSNGLVGFLGILLCIFITFTRTCLIGTFFALVAFMILLVIYCRDILWRFRYLILCIFAGIVISTLVLFSIYYKPNPLNPSGESLKDRLTSSFTVLQRFMLWESTFHIIFGDVPENANKFKHFWFGTGVGTFGYFYPLAQRSFYLKNKFYISPMVNSFFALGPVNAVANFFSKLVTGKTLDLKANPPLSLNSKDYEWLAAGFGRVHNEFLQAWVDLGLIGLIIFLWMFYDFFKAGCNLLGRLRKTFSANRILVIGYMCAIVGSLGESTGNFPFQRIMPPMIAILAFTLIHNGREIFGLYSKDEEEIIAYRGQDLALVPVDKLAFYGMIGLLFLPLMVIPYRRIVADIALKTGYTCITQAADPYNDDEIYRAYIEKAIQELEECVRLIPWHSEAYFWLADAYKMKSMLPGISQGERLKLLETALDRLNTSLIYSNTKHIFYSRGTILLELFRLTGEEQLVPKAIADLKISVEMNPNFAPPYLQLGLLEYQANRTKEAIPYFEKAVQWSGTTDPKYEDSLRLLALSHYNEGNYTKSIEVFEQLFRKNPAAKGARKYYGGSLFNIGSYEAAIRAWNKALEENPSDEEIHSHMVSALAKLDSSAVAVEYATRYLNANPSSAKANHVMGTAYLQAGDTEKALFYYLKALELDSRAHLTMDKIATIYYMVKNDPKTAASYWRDAIKIEPGIAKYRYNLGVCLLKMGMAEEALEQWLEVKKIRKDYEEIDRYIEMARAIIEGRNASSPVELRKND